MAGYVFVPAVIQAVEERAAIAITVWMDPPMQDEPDFVPATLILHSGAPEGQPEGEKTDA